MKKKIGNASGIESKKKKETERQRREGAMPMPAVSGPRALHTGDRVSLHLYDGAACLCSETVYNEAGAEQTRLVVAGHSPPSPPRYVSTPRAPSPLPPLESV